MRYCTYVCCAERKYGQIADDESVGEMHLDDDYDVLQSIKVRVGSLRLVEIAAKVKQGLIAK